MSYNRCTLTCLYYINFQVFSMVPETISEPQISSFFQFYRSVNSNDSCSSNNSRYPSNNISNRTNPINYRSDPTPGNIRHGRSRSPNSRHNTCSSTHYRDTPSHPQYDRTPAILSNLMTELLPVWEECQLELWDDTRLQQCVEV